MHKKTAFISAHFIEYVFLISDLVRRKQKEALQRRSLYRTGLIYRRKASCVLFTEAKKGISKPLGKKTNQNEGLTKVVIYRTASYTVLSI
ncbi:hypothetical protein DC20_14670 [Rufibacter tibetensis]|uniref:Uncharacterized protein n=1 Tax=Rufibacter tibetensis TaxID=512763 RepID=A0A0P0CDU8_9BACT|nr:hypothetical protein DC20_14670 [Rufibacter tibetensis]